MTLRIEHHRIGAFADLDAGRFIAAGAVNEFRDAIVAAHGYQQIVALVVGQTCRPLAALQRNFLYNLARRDIDGQNLTGLVALFIDVNPTLAIGYSELRMAPDGNRSDHLRLMDVDQK